MTSILSTIYDKLEAMTVTFVDKTSTSVNPAVYSQETFAASVQTAHLPARILMPPSGSSTIMPGGNQDANWQITDLCLIEAAGQGQGVKGELPAMTRYIAAYLTAIGKLWQMQSEYHTEDATLSTQITSGLFEYPTASGVWWYGVQVDLTITELV